MQVAASAGTRVDYERVVEWSEVEIALAVAAMYAAKGTALWGGEAPDDPQPCRPAFTAAEGLALAKLLAEAIRRDLDLREVLDRHVGEGG